MSEIDLTHGAGATDAHRTWPVVESVQHFVPAHQQNSVRRQLEIFETGHLVVKYFHVVVIHFSPEYQNLCLASTDFLPRFSLAGKDIAHLGFAQIFDAKRLIHADRYRLPANHPVRHALFFLGIIEQASDDADRQPAVSDSANPARRTHGLGDNLDRVGGLLLLVGFCKKVRSVAEGAGASDNQFFFGRQRGAADAH